MNYHCGLCAAVYASAGEPPPVWCLSCQRETDWWPFAIAKTDRRMLKSFKIAIVAPVSHEDEPDGA